MSLLFVHGDADAGAVYSGGAADGGGGGGVCVCVVGLVGLGARGEWCMDALRVHEMRGNLSARDSLWAAGGRGNDRCRAPGGLQHRRRCLSDSFHSAGLLADSGPRFAATHLGPQQGRAGDSLAVNCCHSPLPEWWVEGGSEKVARRATLNVR